MFKRKETIGDCTLYLADAFELMEYLGEFDCLVTDPPYKFDTSGQGIFRKNRHNMERIAAAGMDKGCDITRIPLGLYKAVAIFGHTDQWAEWLPVLAHEFDRYCILTWHKTNPMPVANQHYRPDTEIYVHAWRRSIMPPKGTLKEKSRYFIGLNGKDTTNPHPTVKPLALMEKIIINVGGETIIDPFMGSGTTGIACIRHQRKFTGIENNPAFFDIACNRLEQELTKK